MSSNNEIGEPLVPASEQLMKGYEAINLENGLTLKQVKADQEAATSKIKNFKRKMKVSVLTMFIGMLIIIGSAPLLILGKHEQLGIILMFVLVLYLGSYLVLMWYQRKERRPEEIAKGCALTLKRFKEAVEALRITGRTFPELNEATVRDELVCVAVWILDAQAKFDLVCSQGRKRMDEIMHLGYFIEMNEKKLQDGLYVAEGIFGLKFDKAEIFAGARKHLERMSTPAKLD